MNPTHALRRVFEGGGVACLYGLIQKKMILSHTAVTGPATAITEKEKEREGDRIKELQIFQLNLVKEANELIHNLNHTLREELIMIRKQIKEKEKQKKQREQKEHNIKEEKKEEENEEDEKLENDLENWASKFTKLDVPNLTEEKEIDPKIIDELRIIPEEYLKDILEPNIFRRSRIPPEQLVDAVVKQFYRLEDEVVQLFTDRQLLVNETIKSYRSKVFSESLPGSISFALGTVLQVAACGGFLKLTDKIFKSSPATIALSSPRPVPLWIASLCMVPITWIALGGAPIMINLFQQRKDFPQQIQFQTPPTPIVSPNIIPSPLPSQPVQKHMPLSVYRFIPSPPIHEPFTDPKDPWKFISIFENIIFPPLIEGYIFRKLLLDRFLKSTSPFQAHLLVVLAVVACKVGIRPDSVEIYEIRHTLNQYLSETPPIEKHDQTSNLLIPILVQLSHFITGSFAISVLLDIGTNLFSHVSDFSKRNDLLFSPIHSSNYMNLCKLAALFDDGISSFILRVVNIYNGIKDGREITNLRNEIMKDLLKQYLQVSSSRDASASATFLSTEDALDFQAQLAHYFLNYHLRIKPIMPPRLKELQNRNQMYNYPFSHRPESGYVYEIFADSSKLASMKFSHDADAYFMDNLRLGKFSFDEACFYFKYMLPKEFITNPQNLKDFHKSFFFWDLYATEEQLLDLIQDIYVHRLERALRTIDSFRNSAGAWKCLEYQGHIQGISESDLGTYYEDLEKYVSIVVERDDHVYAGVYGLTPHKLKTIIQRRGKEFPSIVELAKSWDDYFQSAIYREKLRSNGDPLSHFCPRRRIKSPTTQKGDLEEKIKSPKS